MMLSRADPRAALLAQTAALLADNTRAVMCLALLDGRAWTAIELARHAGVAKSTATEHLHRLVDAGLVQERRQGRHRYVQLVDPALAQLLEDLTAHVTPIAVPTGTLRTSTATAALARARTCYDHLAGRLGVQIADALLHKGFLRQDSGFAVTDDGLDWVVDVLGADTTAMRLSRRPLARPCLDWTERRTHIGGTLGAVICQRMLDLQWVRRVGSDRAVRLTRTGVQNLTTTLGMDSSTLD